MGSVLPATRHKWTRPNLVLVTELNLKKLDRAAQKAPEGYDTQTHTLFQTFMTFMTNIFYMMIITIIVTEKLQGPIQNDKMTRPNFNFNFNCSSSSNGGAAVGGSQPVLGVLGCMRIFPSTVYVCVVAFVASISWSTLFRRATSA